MSTIQLKIILVFLRTGIRNLYLNIMDVGFILSLFCRGRTCRQLSYPQPYTEMEVISSVCKGHAIQICRRIAQRL